MSGPSSVSELETARAVGHASTSYIDGSACRGPFRSIFEASRGQSWLHLDTNSSRGDGRGKPARGTPV